MATNKHSAAMSRGEIKFWDACFLNAELPLLAKDGKPLSPVGLAHLAREYADAAVIERRAALDAAKVKP